MGSCISLNNGKLKFQLDEALAIEVALVQNDPSTAHKLIAEHLQKKQQYDKASQSAIDKMAVRVLKSNVLPDNPPELVRESAASVPGQS